MDRKGRHRTKLNHTDKRHKIKYFSFHGMQDPKDPFDAKRKGIIEDPSRINHIEIYFKG